MSKYTVGQSAWYEPNNRFTRPCTVTVTKVGRKWITIDSGHRFDVVTGRDEHYGSSRLWPTQADAEVAARRRALWAEFVRKLTSYGFYSEDRTEAEIRGAARLLGVTL